ncbi:unnamed protein product [Lactuca virosa]|uniref:Carboxylesterase n=1 Tax=Lactuca virosa TaxID=75947 RepID=A0AAU9PGU5_9ASTR|nr:unnamed protein product [Lactuca virosa]
MEATDKSPQPSLSLPLRTRIVLSAISTFTDAACRKNGTVNRRIITLVDFKSQATSKSTNGVSTHDVVLDQTRNLWFRVYVPTEHAGEDLPVMVFMHGGGFGLPLPRCSSLRCRVPSFRKKSPGRRCFCELSPCA